MAKWKWPVFLAALFMTACNLSKIDPQADAVDQLVFNEVRHADDAALDSQFALALKTTEAQEQFAEIQKLIPKKDPLHRKLVHWFQLSLLNKGTVKIFTDEYDYGDRIALVTTRLFWPNGEEKWEIQGFHLQIATLEELAVNDFFGPSKNALEYGFLFLVVFSVLLMLGALVKVVRTRSLKRKWLWCILSFAGLFSFQMNWTSGAININWLTIQFVGAGISRNISRFDPWHLAMTFPVGALLILTGIWANPMRGRKPAPSLANDSLEKSEVEGA
jgi:hypothetical protein